MSAIPEGGGTTLEPRVMLAFNAAGEIEALLGVIAREKDRDSSEFDYVLPTLLRRVQELNSVILSVIGGDHGRKTEEMRRVVCGGDEEVTV